MLVNSLEKMEQIVESVAELSWDGWNVVKSTPTYKGMFSVDGAFKNGQWYNTKVFPLTETGWNIPNSMGRYYEKMEG
jgi:hypothetical protein